MWKQKFMVRANITFYNTNVGSYNFDPSKEFDTPLEAQCYMDRCGMSPEKYMLVPVYVYEGSNNNEYNGL